MMPSGEASEEVDHERASCPGRSRVRADAGRTRRDPSSRGLAAPPTCTSGAHTLSHFGDHVYPETGNGGYTSLHTDIHMIYDAPSNRFLPGNHVVLSARAAQCLTDFSLDFER